MICVGDGLRVADLVGVECGVVKCVGSDAVGGWVFVSSDHDVGYTVGIVGVVYELSGGVQVAGEVRCFAFVVWVVTVPGGAVKVFVVALLLLLLLVVLFV